DGREAAIRAGGRLGERLRLPLLDYLGELVYRDVFVWGAPGAELVEKRSQRIDVGTARGRLGPPHLWSHVVGRPHHRPGAGRGQRRQRLVGHAGAVRVIGAARHLQQRGEAEVEELGRAVLGKDGVRRFDVTVENALAVRGGEPARQGNRDLQGLPPRD